MIIGNINNSNEKLLNYGSPLDICVLCTRERATKERISNAEARRLLDGHMEGKEVIRIPVSGTSVAICLDHIHTLSKENQRTDDKDVLVNCFGGCGKTITVKESQCVEAYLCAYCVQKDGVNTESISAFVKNKEV